MKRPQLALSCAFCNEEPAPAAGRLLRREEDGIGSDERQQRWRGVALAGLRQRLVEREGPGWEQAGADQREHGGTGL